MDSVWNACYETMDTKTNTAVNDNDRKKRAIEETKNMEYLTMSDMEEKDDGRQSTIAAAPMLEELVKLRKTNLSTCQRVLTVTDSMTISTTSIQTSMKNKKQVGTPSVSTATTLTADDDNDSSNRTPFIDRNNALDKSMNQLNGGKDQEEKYNNGIISSSSGNGLKPPLAIDNGVSLATRWSDCYVDKVYTVGCFDLFHEGHRILFQRMRQLGREIIVGVHDSRSIYKLKSRVPVDGTETRMRNVKRYADQVFCVAGTDPSPFVACIVHLRENETAIYVRGDDMINFPARDIVEKLMPVKFLPYTQNVSSTSLRQEHFSHIKPDDEEHLARVN